jgi:hypothetical protein
MRIAVQADDGDAVSISSDVISAEQAVVTLQIENPIYDSVAELEAVTLTIEKARQLAWALLTMADAVEFVSTPITELLSALNCRGRPGAH